MLFLLLKHRQLSAKCDDSISGRRLRIAPAGEVCHETRHVVQRYQCADAKDEIVAEFWMNALRLTSHRSVHVGVEDLNPCHTIAMLRLRNLCDSLAAFTRLSSD